MNMKRVGKICLPVLAYGMFVAELLMIVKHPVRCPYEKNVSEYEIKTEQVQEEKYVCGIDRYEVNPKDPFQIAEISGWLARWDTNGWKPVSADILLQGIDRAYKVRSYCVKRADIYYTDQSDLNDRDLYIGHLSRFPVAALKSGEYRIGFLLEGSRKSAVYWTEEMIVIP